jgi:serine/threonine protein kinase
MTTNTTICPFCSEEIKASAIKCKHCASTVIPVAATAPPTRHRTTLDGQPMDLQDQIAPLGVGAVVREYSIEKMIGQGGMGEVYRAYHSRLKRHVALKVVAPEVLRQPGIRERFEDEADNMVRVGRHENIVELLDFFEEDGRFFMVLEFVPGKELEQVLEERRLTVREVVGYALQVLSGLAHVHAQVDQKTGQPAPIVHRDIKPSNILITPEERAVVIDFGVAKAMGKKGRTKTGAMVGTYEYMSPEQVQGEEVSPASDVYSAGIVLYKMLSGVVPFPQESEGGYECQKAHVEKAPPPIGDFREGIPYWLVAVVEKALSKRAGDRFQNAGEMAAALRAEVVPAGFDPATAACVAPASTQPDQAIRATSTIPVPYYVGGAILALLVVIFLGIKLGGSGDKATGKSGAKKSVAPVSANSAELARNKREAMLARKDDDRGAGLGVQPTPPRGALSKEEVNQLQADTINKAYQIRDASRGLSPKEQLKVWEMQLGSSYAAVRMMAVRELAALHASSPDMVVALVSKVAASDADEDVRMMAEMLVEEWTGGGGKDEASAPVCERRCGGRDCGDDGCGGFCGSCSSGRTCEHGSCRAPAPVCQPACSGRDCGDDGCEGTCGSCRSGWTCEYGSCRPQKPVCQRDCSGKECGDDGCSGSCGICEGDDACEGGLCKASYDVPYGMTFVEGKCFRIGGCGTTNCPEKRICVTSFAVDNQVRVSGKTTWFDASRECSSRGLALTTEAQWELAAISSAFSKASGVEAEWVRDWFRENAYANWSDGESNPQVSNQNHGDDLPGGWGKYFAKGKTQYRQCKSSRGYTWSGCTDWYRCRGFWGPDYKKNYGWRCVKEF